MSITEIEIIDEENTIFLDTKYHNVTLEFFPKDKKFKSVMRAKEDVYYRNEWYEYKININPIEVFIRLKERSDEPPPNKYAVKDGVVLESEIRKENSFNQEEFIKSLKEEVEWCKLELSGGYVQIFYILSLHPEIVSMDDCRKLLRQFIEKIKAGVSRIEEAIKKDTHGLEIYTSEYGKSIWYLKSDAETKESEEYWKLSEEKRLGTKYGKKIEYIEKLNQDLFKEDSSKYVGISQGEFNNSEELIKNIKKLLDKKESPKIKEPVDKISKTKGIIISLLLTLFISWLVSFFVDVDTLTIFILVQVVSFIQSFLGNYVGSFFE